MEIRQNFRRATTRPNAWVAAISVALALVAISWFVVSTSASTPTTNPGKAAVITTTSLLDREAERQQQAPTSRDGGPGGQFGDTP
jgi:hypothetical protein